MQNRREQILEAAIRTISRYGVKRTSVADIADEAGVARQTVYNSFSDKDAILRETVVYIYDATFDAIKNEMKNATDFAERLDIFFDHLAVRKYEMTFASPEADDIISGFKEIAKAEIEQGHDVSRALIEKTLRPYAKTIRASGLSVRDLAEFVERSLANAKSIARDKKHLLKLLTSLKVLVLNLVDE